MLSGGPQVLGALALAACVAVSVAIVLAAAERPSFLSGPARHGFPSWMVGPLGHLLPSTPDSMPALKVDFVAALAILAVAWLIAALCASRLPMRLVWGAVVVAQAVFLLGPPLPLTDVFNYLHYGRMGALHGLNPYVDLPVAARHDPTWLYTNWRHLPSPYGPTFTLLTEGLAPLKMSVAYWVWKAIALAASVGTLAFVATAARRLGRSPQAAVVLVGLNPLVLVYGLGGAHNEPLLLLCAAAAVAFAVIGRDEASGWHWDAAAGACVVLAAGFKPSAALLAPLVVLGCRRRLVALGGAAAAGAVVGLVVLLVYAGHLPATSIQDRLVTPVSFANIMAALAGHGGLTAADRSIAHAALAVATVVAVGAVAWRRSLLPAAAGGLMLALVLSLSWTMPWYVWWVLPFAALARTRVLAAVCVALTIFLGLGAIPQMPRLLHSFGYYPTRTVAGHANHVFVETHVR